jgi:hypothetical protein
MFDTRSGGHRWCPNCKGIRETRVFVEGYGQVPYGNGYAKMRRVICGTDAHGTGGCGYIWVTYESAAEGSGTVLNLEEVSRTDSSNPQSEKPKRKRGGKKNAKETPNP